MAESTLTKRALASALKELMAEVPFEKITVAQICEKCDMNRKSFYYHFRDKYDLANVCVCVLERCLLEKDCITPEQIIPLIESLLTASALSLYKGLDQTT